ncbi:SH2 domain-containing protein 1B-like [Eucyclogobius newberryi]|uniref:SH2 domain-containing protein 1B-like n=1 Tax=Eucyclogobius newberryi TaxID=166745 RepID=UPI003B5C9456
MAADLPLCYHGAISRKDCEDLMGKKKKDGAYLIRDSETFQGAMCLCVYKKHVIYTYRLLKTLSGQYTLLASGEVAPVYFKSLDDLIQHYKRKNQGLTMHLRHSIKRKTALLIRATTQIQNQPQVQSPADQRHSGSQRSASQGGGDEAAAADYKHPRPVQPSLQPPEREEADYENVPEYVEVQPL